MKSVSVVEAKSHFSSLLAEVEAGGEVAVTRYGKVVARLVPGEPPKMAADAFRSFWQAGGFDVEAPADAPPEEVPALDE